jgi:hypothetical protein
VSARALLDRDLLLMGVHVAAARVRRAARGHRRYPGSAEAILRAGLEDCWTGELLTASPGHYRQFWTRDTGFAARSLARLGEPWPKRLLSSLAWAIRAWRDRGGHVTTTINPLHRGAADVFDYGVDSLPLLLWSLRALTDGPDTSVADRARALVRAHEPWIAAEVEQFVELVVDPATGLVRSDRAFSAHRDTFRNSSTAYANTMVALLARTVVETGWGRDLLSKQFDRAGASRADGASDDGAPDWGALLRRHFWLDDRFRDRLGSDETSGEANVVPFFFGVVDDRPMLAAVLETLRREGYARPYPLRFDVVERTRELLPAFRLWAGDYQTTTIWTSLGSMYLALLQDLDPTAAGPELDRMRDVIQRDGTFWEVLDGSGRMWRNGLSISDQSMLWGAILLEALEAT